MIVVVEVEDFFLQVIPASHSFLKWGTGPREICAVVPGIVVWILNC